MLALIISLAALSVLLTGALVFVQYVADGYVDWGGLALLAVLMNAGLWAAFFALWVVVRYG